MVTLLEHPSILHKHGIVLYLHLMTHSLTFSIAITFIHKELNRVLCILRKISHLFLYKKKSLFASYSVSPTERLEYIFTPQWVLNKYCEGFYKGKTEQNNCQKIHQQTHLGVNFHAIKRKQNNKHNSYLLVLETKFPLHSLYDKSQQTSLIYGDKHPPNPVAQCIIVNFLFISNASLPLLLCNSTCFQARHPRRQNAWERHTGPFYAILFTLMHWNLLAK